MFICYDIYIFFLFLFGGVWYRTVKENNIKVTKTIEEKKAKRVIEALKMHRRYQKAIKRKIQTIVTALNIMLNFLHAFKKKEAESS